MVCGMPFPSTSSPCSGYATSCSCGSAASSGRPPGLRCSGGCANGARRVPSAVLPLRPQGARSLHFPRDVFFFFGATVFPLAAACFCFFFAGTFVLLVRSEGPM